MFLENEQAPISKKKLTNAFSVNRKLVNSKQFKDKFEGLPLSQECKNRVYKEVCRLLEFVDGKEDEHMIAVDFFDGHFIVDNFGREGHAKSTAFTQKEYDRIGDSMVTLIHNHSGNGRPSATDIKSFYNDEKVCLSIIACHNGTLYAIFKVEKAMLSVYEELFTAEKELVGNREDAKKIATSKLYILNEKSHGKLFDVRML